MSKIKKQTDLQFKKEITRQKRLITKELIRLNEKYNIPLPFDIFIKLVAETAIKSNNLDLESVVKKKIKPLIKRMIKEYSK